MQDEKCELALKSGAEYAFNSAKDPKFIEKIIEVTGGGVHAVVNTSVHPSACWTRYGYASSWWPSSISWFTSKR
nr:zinc-binding dehydrogenase [Mycoplasmopsis bovis]